MITKTLLEERLGRQQSRRPTRLQLRLAREFDSDILRFERGFRVDILKELERLGRQVEEVALEVLEAEPKGLKDTGRNAMDAALIMDHLDVAGFEADLGIVYGKHYRRILKATESRVNAVMELGVSIPEPLEAQVLANGGKRVGLLDMSGKTKRRVFEQLSQGRSEGEAVDQLARRLREFIPAGRFKSVKTRATLIARTETTHAQRTAAAASYRQGGVTNVLILDSRKGHFDDECDAVNGIVVSLAEGEALMADEHPSGTRRMIAMPPNIPDDIG